MKNETRDELGALWLAGIVLFGIALALILEWR